MTTALTAYLSSQASTTLSTANQIYITSGTPGTQENEVLIGTVSGWGEMYAQGNASAFAGSGSIGSPSGHGFYLETSILNLAGQQIISGNWSATIRSGLKTTGDTATVTFVVRAYKYSGGVYTNIVTMTSSSQGFSGSGAVTITLPSTAGSVMNFSSGDTLYIDVWAHVTAAATISSQQLRFNSLSTDTSGHTGSANENLVSPGYQVGVTTSTRTVPATTALLATSTRTIVATTALLATNTRTISTTTALLATKTRTIPATTALGASRIIPATTALLQTSTRTILATTALLQTSARTILATTALLQTSSRTIPATTALTNTKTRTILSTTALLQTSSRTIATTTALTNTSTRTIPATTALYLPSIFYASNVASSIGGLTQSDQMSQIIGGTETSVSVTMPSSGTNSYVELVSQGGTPGATSALPLPTGKGWSINLAGNTILAGSWFGTFTLAKSGTTMSGASLIARWYRRTMDGTYYPIAVSTLSGQSYSTTKAVYSTPSVAALLWQFVAGDTLYMDAFVLNGAAWASDVFTVYVSNNAAMGVANDGTTTTPQVISTPAGLSCYVGIPSFQNGATIPVLNQSFMLADALDQRSILTLTGEDAAGTLSYVPGQPVILSDHDQGKLYDGYLASDKVSRPSAGGAAQLEHAMTFADHHRDYDKRANTTNYLNWTAGDMACDFIQSTLSQEGITGQFALESDYTPATFSQGTLTNTVATTTTSPFTYAPNTATPPITSNTGDLELTRAGTQLMLTETVTSDFSGGTLTNMVASNNQLSPSTQSAIKVTAQYSPVAGTVNVPKQEGLNPAGTQNIQTDEETIVNLIQASIWTGSMTVGTNDTLNYDLWISSTSPSYQVGADILFSDGSRLSDNDGFLDSSGQNGLFDTNGCSADVLQDLSTYAKDCWYTRTITLTGLNGKTINEIDVYLASSASGAYTFYVKNCYLGSQSGSPFFGTAATSIQDTSKLTGKGAYITSTINRAVVTVFNPLVSSRVSPAHSISSVGLVQNSTITWTASLPTSGTAPVTYPPGTTGTNSSGSGTGPSMVMLVSYDNATWLLCQNSQALPGLPPGANVSGLSLYLKEQFAAGSDPTAIPALLDVQITINSAANQTVSDIITSYGTATQWNTGTQVLTNPNSAGNLTLGGSANPLTQNWASSSVLNTQTFLPGALNSGTQAVSGGAYTMTTGAITGGSYCQSRFDWAGYFQNGTIEADLKVSASGNYETGIEYRQTGWGNANNNGAYYVCIQTSGTVLFGFGQNNANNSSGTFTVVALSTQTINSGTYYHVKIVVNGNRHTIYFNRGSTPILDILDNTYTAAGQIGMKAYTGTSNSFTASIDNFSMITTTSGTWTGPSTSLTSLGTCGYSQVCWTDLDSRGQIEATAIVLASVDGGTSWMQCSNGAEVPQLARGASTSGMNLKFQMILYSNSPPISTPVIMGLYARICGNYGTVTGTRISPALNLSPVGYVASSNVMWNANIPTSTTLTVATTQDLSTYHTVGSNGAGEALPYWTNQPAATQDLFSSNTLSNYTNTSKSGGSTASIFYETASSRISLIGGSGGLYLNNSISCTDVDLLCDLDKSDAGGLVWRETSTSNYYELGVYDGSSSSGFTNQLRLYKVSSGTRSLLGSASAITFTRGTFHRIRVTMQGGLINVYFDGQCVQSYLDLSPLGVGPCGLRNDGGTSRYYQFNIQPLGTNLTGQSLYTKTTMTTSDPSVMPQLFTLVACVRGSSIATGATIPQLHPATTPFATFYSNEMDAMVQASGDYYWYVDRWRQLHIGPRLARPGAFPLQSVYDPANSSGYLLYLPQVSVNSSADLFRSQQIMTNVTGLVTPPVEVKAADGSTTSWTLGYPVYSAPTILINGSPATIGVQGIDNNRQFYWQPGSSSISYDNTLPKLPAGTIISITYVGQSTVNDVLNSSGAQSAQAALEGNSGIVASIQSAQLGQTKGMTTAQATTFGNGLLSRYGINNPIEAMGTTLYAGLVPGTTISLFLPEMMSTWNAQLPIVKVTTTAYQTSNNGIVYFYAIDATNGANQSNWQRVFFS